MADYGWTGYFNRYIYRLRAGHELFSDHRGFEITSRFRVAISTRCYFYWIWVLVIWYLIFSIVTTKQELILRVQSVQITTENRCHFDVSMYEHKASLFMPWKINFHLYHFQTHCHTYHFYWIFIVIIESCRHHVLFQFKILLLFYQ